MFKITPAASEQQRRSAAHACAVRLQEGSFMYIMVDGEDGHLMGLSQFDISCGHGRLTDLAEVPGADDDEAMFILGRATMSFVESCGITTLYAAPDAAPVQRLRALGFKEKDGGYVADLSGMFHGHCTSHT